MSSPAIVYAVTLIFPDRGRPVVTWNWRKHLGGYTHTWTLTPNTFFVKWDDGKGTTLVYQVDICKVGDAE